MKTKTLQEQYNLIKEGKGNKEIFLKEAKLQFPHLIRNAADFNETTTILKQRSVISENILQLGLVTQNKKQDWFDIFNQNIVNEAEKSVKAEENLDAKYAPTEEYKYAVRSEYIIGFQGREDILYFKSEEEAKKYVAQKPSMREYLGTSLHESVKAEEKNVSKEVEDYRKNAYDNADMKNADNVNFNEIMKGFYAEMKDPKNADKTGDELKAMVVKNLAKDPLYYTKNGEFGTKGVGYTTEAPGLGEPKEPKGKYKSSGYGDLGTKTEKVKANVQDSLGDKEAKTSMPKKVKEMPVAAQNSSGVKKMPTPGKEKKMKLQENTDILDYYLSIIDSNDMSRDEAYDFLEDTELTQAQINSIMDYAFPIKADEDIPFQGMTEEQKLRSVIRNIIKEELDENKTLIKKGDVLYHENSGATLEVIDVEPETVTMKVTKIEEKTPKYIKVGQTSKTTPSAIGKTYTKK